MYGKRRLIIENDSKLSQEEMNAIDFAVKITAKSYPFIKGWELSEYHKEKYDNDFPIIYINLIINLDEVDGFLDMKIKDSWKKRAREEQLTTYYLAAYTESNIYNEKQVLEQELNLIYVNCPNKLFGKEYKKIFNSFGTREKPISIDQYITELPKNTEMQVEQKVRKLLLSIINEGMSYDDLKSEFDTQMNQIGLNKLIPSVREYYDENTDETYDRLHFYKKNDYDEDDENEIDEDDWENDWWIFSIGNEEKNMYDLYYNKEETMIKDMFSKFPKSKVNEFLPIWFTETYKDFLEKFNINLEGIYKIYGK